MQCLLLKKHLFLYIYHNMRQENSVSIHARTKVSSHCSIGNIVCNGHTQTLFHVSEQHQGGKKKVCLFPIYNRMCINEIRVFFLVIGHQCDQLYLKGLLQPEEKKRENKEITHPTTNQTTFKHFKGQLVAIYKFSSHRRMVMQILHSNLFMW